MQTVAHNEALLWDSCSPINLSFCWRVRRLRRRVELCTNRAINSASAVGPNSYQRRRKPHQTLKLSPPPPPPSSYPQKKHPFVLSLCLPQGCLILCRCSLIKGESMKTPCGGRTRLLFLWSLLVSLLCRASPAAALMQVNQDTVCVVVVVVFLTSACLKLKAEELVSVHSSC